VVDPREYTDRITKITGLRSKRTILQTEIDNEIAKGWRLRPGGKTKAAFALQVGLTVTELNALLLAMGIH
jgi:hypothetical protein